MYKIILFLLLSLCANATDLAFVSGEIKAHTEVFGESNIDPVSKQIESQLTIDNTISSVKGKLSLASLSLKSDKSARDEHMYEVLNAKEYPFVTFDVKKIVQTDNTYTINGLLTLNGVTKEIVSSAKIKDDATALNMSGSFSINLTDFGMEPPTLLFLTVRDQIDITYNLTFKK